MKYLKHWFHNEANHILQQVTHQTLVNRILKDVLPLTLQTMEMFNHTQGSFGIIHCEQVVQNK
jgi:hypothetical protein